MQNLPGPPKVQLFSSPPPKIVGVGGFACRVCCYIDVPLGLAGVEVAKSLVLVDKYPFPLSSAWTYCAFTRQLSCLKSQCCFDFTSVIAMCLAPRFTSTLTYSASPLVAYTVGAVSIKPISETLVKFVFPLQFARLQNSL